MSADYIDPNAVKAAIEAAKNSLKNDSDIAWIRNSAFLERAYYLGLYKGLSSISDDQSLDVLLLHCLMNTIWERDVDNSFISTQIGKNFEQLKVEFDKAVSGKEINLSSAEATIELIEVIDKEWRHCVKNAREIIYLILKASAEFNCAIEKKSLNQNQQYEILEKMNPLGLEELLKHIALLETNHELYKKSHS
jgi:hypothetical protein